MLLQLVAIAVSTHNSRIPKWEAHMIGATAIVGLRGDGLTVCGGLRA